LNAAEDGMELWMLGPDEVDLAASAFERVVHDHLGGRPRAADPVVAAALIALAGRLASDGTPVVHDVSDGGLAVALAEICIQSGVGATVEVEDWRTLFSEAPHRLLVALEPASAAALALAAAAAGVPARRLGQVGGGAMLLASPGTVASVSVEDATAAYRLAIPRRMR
jgi:phosphoribosylformylglycinamidine synthase